MLPLVGEMKGVICLSSEKISKNRTTGFVCEGEPSCWNRGEERKFIFLLYLFYNFWIFTLRSYSLCKKVNGTTCWKLKRRQKPGEIIVKLNTVHLLLLFLEHGLCTKHFICIKCLQYSPVLCDSCSIPHPHPRHGNAFANSSGNPYPDMSGSNHVHFVLCFLLTHLLQLSLKPTWKMPLANF